jgi:7-carboxy-7-deazaguanine synthase
VRISEIFYSIEGEGIQIGRLEIFVRLSNCNLNCKWCDTKYAKQDGKEMEIQDILSEIEKYPCKNISITGGEPLCQSNQLLDLLNKLKSSGYWVQINTNGTLFDQRIFELVDLVSMDCKCPSSGEESNLTIIEKTVALYDYKMQLKFVVSDKLDLDYAKQVIKRLNPTHSVIQPEWAHRKFASTIVDSVKNDGLTPRIIIQQHKVIWGNKKGV